MHFDKQEKSEVEDSQALSLVDVIHKVTWKDAQTLSVEQTREIVFGLFVYHWTNEEWRTLRFFLFQDSSLPLDGTSWRHVRVQPIMGVNVNGCNDCWTSREVEEGELLVYPRMSTVVPKSRAQHWAISSYVPDAFRFTNDGTVRRSFG